MSDLIVIQPQVTELTVTEDVNQVVVSSVGVQGAKGDTGATGATGAQGSSGVIAVTAPITNSGTSTSANIGVSAGSTSTAGVLQLTDSTSSTSTTTAATPNAVKTAYDLAAAAQSRATFIAAWDNLFSQSSTIIDTIPRIGTGNSTIINGAIVFIPVVPVRDFTVTNIAIHTVTGGTDIGGTTVRKFGIYTLSGTTMTLQRATANDSTIGNVTGTLYTRALTSTYALTAGSIYYVAVICYNTGGTFNSPSFSANTLASSSLANILPQLASRKGSQTDLASSVDVAGVNANNTFWMRLT